MVKSSSKLDVATCNGGRVVGRSNIEGGRPFGGGGINGRFIEGEGVDGRFTKGGGVESRFTEG